MSTAIKLVSVKGFYKHKKWRDLRWETLKVLAYKPEYMEIQGRYWIKGTESTWCVGFRPVIIKVKYTEPWEKIDVV